MFWGGAVEARRSCVGRCGAGMALGGRYDGSGGEVGSLERGLGVGFVGSAAAPRLSCCCVCVFECGGGDALIVGVGDPDAKGVVSAVPAVLAALVVSAAT
jgi:hypothetical protein